MSDQSAKNIHAKLENLELLQEFNENKLTVLRLALATKQDFDKVRNKLYSAGHPHPIDYGTTITEDWVNVVLKRISLRSLKFTEKTDTDKYGNKNVDGKGKKKRAYRKKKKKKKDNSDNKPLFISVPMGGKVR